MQTHWLVYIPIQFSTYVRATCQQLFVLEHVLGQLMANLDFSVRDDAVYIAKVVIHFTHLTGFEIDLYSASCQDSLNIGPDNNTQLSGEHLFPDIVETARVYCIFCIGVNGHSD